MEFPGEYYSDDYDMPTTPMAQNWWQSLASGDYGVPTMSLPEAYDFDDNATPTMGGQSSGSLGGLLSFLTTNGQRLRGLLSGAGQSGGMGGFNTGAGIAALLGALASRNSRQEAAGGGVGQAYAGPQQITRTIEQGRYGPIARYAANGGVMHAYAHGGAVKPFPMQDGGFVMTKRAVDGAGGFDGMQQRLPEAQPIVGPGHGTSDSIPAYIQGAKGRTPAAVSNGEMYVPPGRNTKGLYALMKSLERKA